MNSRKQNRSCTTDHAKSRTKMTCSEESWLATQPISAARCRLQDEVHRRRSVGTNRCAERARAVSRPRSYDRPHRNIIYTMYNGGPASEEISRRPQFPLKNELTIACKKWFVPPPGVAHRCCYTDGWVVLLTPDRMGNVRFQDPALGKNRPSSFIDFIHHFIMQQVIRRQAQRRLATRHKQ